MYSRDASVTCDDSRIIVGISRAFIDFHHFQFSFLKLISNSPPRRSIDLKAEMMSKRFRIGNDLQPEGQPFLEQASRFQGAKARRRVQTLFQ